MSYTRISSTNHPKLILVLLCLPKTLVTKVMEASHLRSLVWLEMVNYLVFVGIVAVKGTSRRTVPVHHKELQVVLIKGRKRTSKKKRSDQ